MEKKRILLICGGGGTEHEVSLRSAQFILDSLEQEFTTTWVEIGKDNTWRTSENQKCELTFSRELILENGEKLPIDYAIPCIHGIPGETGDIQSFFEMIHLPYLGCNSEASKLCFNKISSKLWFSSKNIPNTPYVYLSDMKDLSEAEAALGKWGTAFVKASNQGSSVGCFKVSSKEELTSATKQAFELSPYVLIEKELVGRELEVSVYEYENKVIATAPGEILCPNAFYTYEEKYNGNSQTSTQTEVTDIKPEKVEKIKEYALKAFNSMKLRHLSRIDFFYTNNEEIYINEINTFPGMTSISMFPKMLEANGDSFKKFLKDTIYSGLR